MRVIHIVMFKFMADASPDAIQKVYQDMLDLRKTCTRKDSNELYIKSLTGGKDHSPEGLQNGIDYAFVVEFESIEDRDYYLFEDEAHGKFKETATSFIERAIVVDYTVDPLQAQG